MFPFLKRLALFGVFLLIGLEAVFRTVIPAAEMPAGFQDPDYLIMHLDRNARPDGHLTMGRLGRPRFAWKVNNYGFNSSLDYKKPSEREAPCVAVIGNSFTEGLYNDVDEHLAGQLQTAMGDAVEVYNLGTSGMSLSQYPLMVAYARDQFAPDLIIIQAGAGSVENSLRENGSIPYCRQFTWEADRLVSLPPSGFAINQRNRMLRNSALVRYLFYNSNFNLGGQGNVQKAGQAPEPGDSGKPAQLAEQHLDVVLETVLGEFRELVPDIPILIVFDADLRALYAGGRTPDRLRNSPLLEGLCRSHGIHFVDMTTAFSTEYLARGRKFNFEDNYHWDTYGVSIVAGAIMAKLKAENLFGNGRLMTDSPTAP